jgi:hypothetical protein
VAPAPSPPAAGFVFKPPADFSFFGPPRHESLSLSLSLFLPL